jgi:hypothetical protein
MFPSTNVNCPIVVMRRCLDTDTLGSLQVDGVVTQGVPTMYRTVESQRAHDKPMDSSVNIYLARCKPRSLEVTGVPLISYQLTHCRKENGKCKPDKSSSSHQGS